MQENSRKQFLLHIYAFFLGIVLTFSFPPFFFFPAAFLSFSGLFLILKKIVFVNSKNQKKRVFLLGYWFGFGHFLSSLYWISNSLLVDMSFAWMLPFAIMLIPAFLSIYLGFAIVLFFVLLKKARLEIFTVSSIALFSLIWVLFEFLRANLFYGFPWNLIGYNFLFKAELAQFASVIGVYGLSFLFVFLSLLLFVKNRIKYLFFPAVIIALYGFGLFHMQNEITGQKYKIRIIQPNIPQSLKWDNKKAEKNFAKIISLLDDKKSDVGLTILPEAAIPYHLESDFFVRKMLSENLKTGEYLLLGSTRFTEEENIAKYYNAIEVINSEGEIIDFYHKNKLVPFGEFVPLRNIFSFINKITPGSSDIAKGDGFKNISLNNLPKIMPLICYEVIFSGLVAKTKLMPDLIVNVTNDAWFGNSIGPYQHFNMSRMRAIEQGSFLARSANTGISAFVTPFGVVLEKMELNKTGQISIKTKIGKVDRNYMLYKKYGIIIPIIFIIVFCLVIFSFSLRKTND